MKKLGPAFNTHRMIEEYFSKYYKSGFDKRLELQDKKWKKAKDLANWKQTILNDWSRVSVKRIETNGNSGKIFVGQEFPVKAEIDLGSLTPIDVEVQIYYGPLDNKDYPQLNNTEIMETTAAKSKSGVSIYSGNITCKMSGQQGFTIRILPKNPLLFSPFELGVVYWAE